jgi:hypothetical protein
MEQARKQAARVLFSTAAEPAVGGGGVHTCAHLLGKGIDFGSTGKYV